MQLLLKQDCKDLGKAGEIVSVKPGFARNFLLPRRLAVPCDKSRKAEWVHLQKVAQIKAKKAVAARQTLAEKLQALQLEFERQASAPTSGAPTSGAPTSGAASSGAPTSGAPTSGAAASAAATSGVSVGEAGTTGDVTSGVATSGAVASGVATSGVAASGSAARSSSTRGGGRLFGSVSALDISKQLESLGFHVDKRDIHTSPLKSLGVHQVPVKLGPQTETTLQITIKAIQTSQDDDDGHEAQSVEQPVDSPVAESLADESVANESAADESVAEAVAAEASSAVEADSASSSTSTDDGSADSTSVDGTSTEGTTEGTSVKATGSEAADVESTSADSTQEASPSTEDQKQ